MDLTIIAVVGSVAVAVAVRLVPFLANHLVRHPDEPRLFPRPRRHGSG